MHHGHTHRETNTQQQMLILIMIIILLHNLTTKVKYPNMSLIQLWLPKGIMPCHQTDHLNLSTLPIQKSKIKRREDKDLLSREKQPLPQCCFHFQTRNKGQACEVEVH